MNPKVSAVIVNFNSGNYLERCLRHLLASECEGGLEVFVVNNSPADLAMSSLKAAFPGVHFMEPGINLGFSPANNLALERAKGEFFLLVNPDAFVPPHAIALSLAYFEANPRAGVAGGRFRNMDELWQPSARRFPNILDKFFMLSGLAARFPNNRLTGRVDMTWWDHATAREVDWVVGAFFMTRADLFRHLGGFDSRFFLYFEEMEYCRRAKRAGFKVCFLPEVVVHHVGGGSSQQSLGQARAGKQLTLFRLISEALYYGKYHGRLGPAVMLGLERLWTWLRWLKYRGKSALAARERAEALALHLKLVGIALRITEYGRTCPPRPWQTDYRAYEEGANG